MTGNYRTVAESVPYSCRVIAVQPRRPAGGSSGYNQLKLEKSAACIKLQLPLGKLMQSQFWHDFAKKLYGNHRSGDPISMEIIDPTFQ